MPRRTTCPTARQWTLAAVIFLTLQPLIVLRSRTLFKEEPCTFVQFGNEPSIHNLTSQLRATHIANLKAEEVIQALRAQLSQTPGASGAVASLLPHGQDKPLLLPGTRPPLSSSSPLAEVVSPVVTRPAAPIFVVKPHLHAHGGVFGEYKIFVALLWGLRELEVNHSLIESDADVEKARREGKIGASTVVVTDQYTQDSIVQAVQPREARRFNIDYWGTPQAQARRGTVEKQYLVPHPNGFNTFLGYRVQDDSFRANPPRLKERIVLIWGKERKYFTSEVKQMLRAVIAENGDNLTAIYTTIRTMGSKGRKGSEDEDLGYPTKVRHLGLLSAQEYGDLLSRAAIVMGLGDPVLGPTAMDALEHGCALVQLKFPHPKIIRSVNPRLPWRTQHDAAEDLLGSPWVSSTTFDRYPDAVKAALALQERSPVRSRLPFEYSDAALLDRTRAWVNSLSIS